MEYFQARISRETAQYYQLLTSIYEQKENSKLTQANIISQAIEDVSGLSQWAQVIKDETIKINSEKELTDKDLRIRVKLNPQVQESIQNYKYYLPQFTNTRSITIGVTLKFIFKGAILINSNPELVDNTLKDIDNIIDKYETKLNDLIAPINTSLFESIFKEFKIELLNNK